MASHRELRRFSRRPLEVEIQVGDNTIGGKLIFDTRNVSEGGVFLKSELLMEVGETMWLSFMLPGTAMAIRTRGRVVWVHRTPNDNDPTDIPGMGVQFLDLSDAEQAALQVYLSES